MTATAPLPTLTQAREAGERAAIVAAINATRTPLQAPNLSAAARSLHVSRMTLYRLMDKHGLKADELPLPAEALPQPALDETWHYQIGHETLLRTGLITDLSPRTVEFQADVPPFGSVRQRYTRDLITFVERVATPAPAAAEAPYERAELV
jgi:hypothetical protein